MKRERDNLGDDISNPDQNSAENLNYLEYSIEDEVFHIDIATFASLAQAQDSIIESREIAKDELLTSPRQESGFGGLESTETIQGERAKRLYEQFDRELADAILESEHKVKNIHEEPRINHESDAEKKGKGRARPSIYLSLIGSTSTYDQSSLYQNLLEQEKYDPSIHGSSSRDLLGSLAPYSHLDPSELKLTATEQEFVDNGILSYDEILQQRIQISQFEGQGIFQSQPQSQGLFSERTNPFAQNSGEGESMAKSGPARGIDHEFIERQGGGLGSSSEGYSADGGIFKSPEPKYPIYPELINENTILELTSPDYNDYPPSLMGSEEGDEDLNGIDELLMFREEDDRQGKNDLQKEDDNKPEDLNETEIELLESGVSRKDILKLREQMAQEQIQPLSAESLDSNSSQKSPSRE